MRAGQGRAGQGRRRCGGRGCQHAGQLAAGSSWSTAAAAAAAGAGACRQQRSQEGVVDGGPAVHRGQLALAVHARALRVAQELGGAQPAGEAARGGRKVQGKGAVGRGAPRGAQELGGAQPVECRRCIESKPGDGGWARQERPTNTTTSSGGGSSRRQAQQARQVQRAQRAHQVSVASSSSRRHAQQARQAQRAHQVSTASSMPRPFFLSHLAMWIEDTPFLRQPFGKEGMCMSLAVANTLQPLGRVDGGEVLPAQGGGQGRSVARPLPPCLPPRPGDSRRRLPPHFPARSPRDLSHQTPISTTVTASTCAAQRAQQHMGATSAAPQRRGQAGGGCSSRAAGPGSEAVGGGGCDGGACSWQTPAIRPARRPAWGYSAPARHRGSLVVQATAASVPRSRPHGGPPHGRSARPSSTAPTHPPPPGTFRTCRRRATSPAGPAAGTRATPPGRCRWGGQSSCGEGAGRRRGRGEESSRGRNEQLAGQGATPPGPCRRGGQSGCSGEVHNGMERRWDAAKGGG